MIKVYYPHGGKHFLLHWWSYNERGNIILNTNESSLQFVAEKVFQEHTDAEIKAYWEIDIVAPSEQMQQAAAKEKHRDEINLFHTILIAQLRDLLEAKETLPSLFQVCTSYEVEEEDNEPSEWGRERHYGCKNCSETICCSLSKEELHAKYYQAWREKFPTHFSSYINPKSVVSRADLAKDGEELFYADTSSFGHHGQGVELKQFDPEYPCYTDNLFWFRKVKELDHSSFSSALEKKQKLWADERAALEAATTAACKKSERKTIEKVLAIFQGEQQ